MSESQEEGKKSSFFEENRNWALKNIKTRDLPNISTILARLQIIIIIIIIITIIIIYSPFTVQTSIQNLLKV
jgi:hypothetical protein